MKDYKVKDLYVPLAEYATVQENATLFEAVSALEKAQETFDHTRYRHRAILVLDAEDRVSGKISQIDVLRALEPKYRDLLNGHGSQRYGFTKKFMHSMLENYNLFENPLKDICDKVSQDNVKSFMNTISEGEYVSESATLDQAVHQFILGHHQSLLVTRNEAIIGVLRLTDVFAAVYHIMRECRLPKQS